MNQTNLVEEVNILQLEELIEQRDIVIVDFWATWCVPCQSFAKVFADVAAIEIDICFVKMNIGDASSEVMDTLGICSVPHLMIFTIPKNVLQDLVSQTKILDTEKS